MTPANSAPAGACATLPPPPALYTSTHIHKCIYIYVYVYVCVYIPGTMPFNAIGSSCWGLRGTCPPAGAFGFMLCFWYRCVAVCCSVSKWVAVCCSVSQWVARERRTLREFILHFWCIQYIQNANTATHGDTLQHVATNYYACTKATTQDECIKHIQKANTATHCNTLQHTTIRVPRLRHKTDEYSISKMQTLQHTARHCNTLQHIATH